MSFRVRRGMVVAAVVAVAVSAASHASVSAEPRAVRVAADRLVVHETFFNHMSELCPRKYGLELEFVPGVRYPDRVLLLTRKNVEFAASGYGTLPTISEQDLPAVTIAGTNLGALDLVVRTGVRVRAWRDLIGKTVGVATNSIPDHQLRIALGQRRIDAKRVRIVSLVPSAAALIALQRGDVDAAALWEPWSTKAVAQGIGYIPFDFLDSRIGPVNGLLQVHADTLRRERAMVTRFVRCMIESMRHLGSHPAEHIRRMQVWSGLSPEEARIAARNFSYDWRIYVQNAAFYAHVLHRFGLMRTDQRESILRLKGIDYSILEEVTGKRPRELGKGLFAPKRR